MFDFFSFWGAELVRNKNSFSRCECIGNLETIKKKALPWPPPLRPNFVIANKVTPRIYCTRDGNETISSRLATLSRETVSKFCFSVSPTRNLKICNFVNEKHLFPPFNYFQPHHYWCWSIPPTLFSITSHFLGDIFGLESHFVLRRRLETSRVSSRLVYSVSLSALGYTSTSRRKFWASLSNAMKLSTQ